MHQDESASNRLLVGAGGLFVAAILALTMVGCGGGNNTTSSSPPPPPPPAPAGLSISSLDKTSVNPFGIITISGSGLDPAKGAISALLMPEGGGTPIAIPVFSANTSTAQFVVPPFFNASAGTFSTGTFDIQLVQISGNSYAQSNVLTGLAVSSLPTVPSTVTQGALTSAIMYGGLNVITSVSNASSTATSLGPLSAKLNILASDLNSLIPAVGAVINNPTQTAAISTPSGSVFNVDGTMLAMTDQLLLAYSEQLLSAVQPGVPGGGPACPPSTGDPSTDLTVCQLQLNTQSVVQMPVNATPSGIGLLASGYLVSLAAWAAHGTASTTGVGVEVANAYGMFLNSLSPYLLTYATATPALAFSNSLSNVGTVVVQDLTVNGGGVVILQGTLDAVTAYTVASALTNQKGDPGPQGGLLISDPPLLAVQFVPVGPATSVVLNPPPGKAVFPVSGIAVPPPAPGQVTVDNTGTGTGTVVSTWPDSQIACGGSCTGTYAGGVVVVLLANYDTTKNLFQGWSGGGCAGTGACSVTVVGGKPVTVTAIFSPMPEQPEVFSGSFLGEVVDHGNGGCPGSATLGGTATANLAPAGTGNGGAFAFSIQINLLQGPGICDVYEGMYTSSGTIARTPGATVTFSSGSLIVVGSFSSDVKTFSGNWGFSQNIGPDVATGTFSMTAP